MTNHTTTQILPIDTNNTLLTTWDQAADAMQALATAESRLAKARARHQERIRALQEEHDAAIAVGTALVASITQDLTEFATLHRADLGKAKSRVVGSGLVGWRASSSLELTRPEEDVLDLLARHRPDCIRTVTTQSVDRVRLKTLEPETLEAVGCVVRTTETFYIETAPAILTATRTRVEEAR